jgi:ATP adenylyltransferase/5',5'''-P-1,P-4-tetraphosphate phosphorylase II
MMSSPAINLPVAMKSLLAEQKQEWEALCAGYEALVNIEQRTLWFEQFAIVLQFNPRRIVSSAAKVDPQSIAERKCFLCHLPPEQRGLAFGDYTILANPFPIFPEHFTIPHKEHIPQRIAGNFPAMLDLARAMAGAYTVFYNGPRCGASAPDHLHFQAGNAHFMPIEIECARVAHTPLIDQPSLRAFTLNDYLRNAIVLESADRAALTSIFDRFYAAMRDLVPAEDEPMMNILATFIGDRWRIILFPRAKHRPSFFFAEGDAKILLSPASVDFGGVCITPVERDFFRLTQKHITEMFKEVSLSDENFHRVCQQISCDKSSQ